MNENEILSNNVYATLDFLTKEHVRDMLDLGTIRTVDGWIKRGILPHYKVGRWVRFKRQDILDHLEKYRVCRQTNWHPDRHSEKLHNVAIRILPAARGN